MVKWDYFELNNDVVFLLKTLKHKYLDTTLKEGKLLFSKPERFQKSKENLSAGQVDPLDSHKTIKASKVFAAPVLCDTKEKFELGKPFLIAENATVSEISGLSKMTPMYCLRKIDKSDFTEHNGVLHFRLDSKIIDRIKNEFQHDSFVLIYNPFELINRIEKKSSCFARSIHYGEIDEYYEDFLSKYKFKQAEMFQKSKEYEWQKEFRIIIEPNNKNIKGFLQIGSLEDIAFGGNIEQLKNGFVFGENEEKIKKYVQSLKRI